MEDASSETESQQIELAMADLILLYRHGTHEIDGVEIELLDGAREILTVAEEYGDRL